MQTNPYDHDQTARPANRPQDQLDLYQEVIDSPEIDGFLDENNLGLGNYSGREMWQQVQSYRDGMFSSTAFARTIRDLAIEETKWELGLNGWEMRIDGDRLKWTGWNGLDDEERQDQWAAELADADDEFMDRRTWIQRQGEWIFEDLVQQRIEGERYPAREAISEIANYDGQWDPPHFRMMMVRHETSRSRGARLIDNLFERVKKMVNHSDDSGGLRR